MALVFAVFALACESAAMDIMTDTQLDINMGPFHVQVLLAPMKWSFAWLDLVGGWPLWKEYEFVSWDDYFQYMENMFQTTNQRLSYRTV
jgi:hypothetical protein